MSALVLAALVALCLLNYYVCRDVRYPAFLISALWLITLTLYYFDPFPINKISLYTGFIFVITVAAFSGGSLLFMLPSRYRLIHPKPQGNHLYKLNSIVKRALLLLSVALFPLLLIKAMELADHSGFDNFFVGLRIELSNIDSRGYGFIGNASLVSFFCTFLHAIEPTNKFREKLQFYFSLLLSLAYAVLSTGRTAPFFLLVVLMGIAWLNGRLTPKKMILGVLVFVLFFGGFAFVLGKGGNLEVSWSENLETLADSTVSYMVGAIPAFDTLVQRNGTPSFGEDSLSGVLNVFYQFTGHPLISPLKDDVEVPFVDNVYTGIAPVYQDFGLLGVIVVFFVIGGVSTLFFRGARAGDNMYIFFYALSLFPLFFMTFSDQYFAPIVYLVRYFAAGYFFFRFPVFIGFVLRTRIPLAQERTN